MKMQLQLKEWWGTHLQGKTFDLSSASLHVIAMVCMLIDHSMKTVISYDGWIFLLGRLAFPIFAFLVAEGAYYTKNMRIYLLRMFVFALLAEIPYDLMKTGMPVEWYDQNVIWTFLIALLCICLIRIAKVKEKKWLYVCACIVACLLGVVLGTLWSTDYGGVGVLTVLVFYLFHKRNWWCRLIQFLYLVYGNFVLLGAMGYGITWNLFGMKFEVPMQGYAVFSLIFIWLYRGRQGHHSKPFQYACYAFYPVHMLALYLIMRLMWG
jgi:hypothetical protein